MLDGKGKPAKLSNGAEARYTLPVGAILSVADGDDVTPGQDLARMPDGRRQDPRHHGRSAARGGAVRSAPSEGSRHHRRKRWPRGVRQGLQEQAPPARRARKATTEPIEYMIPKGKHIPVQEGDFVKKGDYLLDGNPAPQDILSILGVEALANYLVEEIQKVYRLQGVPINDKHIEVIVRQMLQKVEIMDAGDTEFLKGEAVEALDLEDENKRVQELGLKGATAQPMLLGITKASLQTRSFISAASFQETTRVLTEAASYGKSDHARRPEGKRHRRPAHPGGHGRPASALPEARRRARRATGDRTRARRARSSAGSGRIRLREETSRNGNGPGAIPGRFALAWRCRARRARFDVHKRARRREDVRAPILHRDGGWAAVLRRPLRRRSRTGR